MTNVISFVCRILANLLLYFDMVMSYGWGSICDLCYIENVTIHTHTHTRLNLVSTKYIHVPMYLHAVWILLDNCLDNFGLLFWRNCIRLQKPFQFL